MWSTSCQLSRVALVLGPLEVLGVRPALGRRQVSHEAQRRRRRGDGTNVSHDVYMRCHTPLKSLDALATHLASNVTYFEPDDRHGLIVVNKPCNVPLKSCANSNVSLLDVLQPLASELRLDGRLHYVFGPERYTSGLTLLTTKEGSVRSLTKLMRKSWKVERRLITNYLALTMGFPLTDESEQVLTLLALDGERKNQAGAPILEVLHNKSKTNTYYDYSNGMEFLYINSCHLSIFEQPVIEVEGVSKNRYRRNFRRIFRTSVHHRTLSKSRGTPSALVSVSSLDARHHFMSAYLCHQLAPILGEPLYGGRVRSIMGKNVRVEHNNRATSGQVLPEVMLNRLGLRKGEEHLLPKHLHLFRLLIPDYYGKGKGDLSLYAPPPTHFMATAKALDVNVDLDKLMDEDEVRYGAVLKAKSKDSKEYEEEGRDHLQEGFVDATHIALRDMPTRN